MVVGDPFARSQTFDSAYSIYRCYTDGPFEPNPMGVADSDTQTFPQKHCPGGIRVNINFPKYVATPTPTKHPPSSPLPVERLGAD